MTIALLHPPRHTALTPAYVRDTAAEMHAMVRLGRDPAGEKTEDRARAAETMIAVVQSYLTYQSGHLRPRSYRELERHLLRYCKPLHVDANAVRPDYRSRRADGRADS
jgi:hypothetical protein